MKPTIYDVARKADVSIATVSRVLNGTARVSDGPRERVLQAIKELGYRRNAMARSLAIQSTRTLALLAKSFGGIYPSLVIAGAEAEAAATGHHLLAYQVSSHNIDQLSHLLGRVDGVLVTGTVTQEDWVQGLAQEGMPTVILGSYRPELGMDGVVVDNYGGAYAATEHLIGHGYRRIAHIAGPDHSRHAQERRRGYLAALNDHGIAVRPEWIAAGDYAHEEGERVMLALLALPERPDAVLAGDDQMAFGACRVIQQQGSRVPDDIALIGFDGWEAGAYLSPPLTTVIHPMRALGQEAVRTLLWRVEHPDAEPREVVLPAQLLVRCSCGCSPEKDPSSPKEDEPQD